MSERQRRREPVRSCRRQPAAAARRPDVGLGRRGRRGRRLRGLDRAPALRPGPRRTSCQRRSPARRCSAWASSAHGRRWRRSWPSGARDAARTPGRRRRRRELRRRAGCRRCPPAIADPPPATPPSSRPISTSTSSGAAFRPRPRARLDPGGRGPAGADGDVRGRRRLGPGDGPFPLSSSRGCGRRTESARAGQRRRDPRRGRPVQSPSARSTGCSAPPWSPRLDALGDRAGRTGAGPAGSRRRRPRRRVARAADGVLRRRRPRRRAAAAAPRPSPIRCSPPAARSGARLGVAIESPPALAMRPARDRLAAIARASRVRTRQVTLDVQLVAVRRRPAAGLSTAGEPTTAAVALLAGRLGARRATGSSTRRAAIAWWSPPRSPPRCRPSPTRCTGRSRTRPLGVRDLLRFGLRGGGADL